MRKQDTGCTSGSHLDPWWSCFGNIFEGWFCVRTSAAQKRRSVIRELACAGEGSLRQYRPEWRSRSSTFRVDMERQWRGTSMWTRSVCAPEQCGDGAMVMYCGNYNWICNQGRRKSAGVDGGCSLCPVLANRGSSGMQRCSLLYILFLLSQTLISEKKIFFS